jgi:hypothetical protein
VQGGASRIFNNTPKKSLRLLFKDAYGPGRLEAPVLAEGGTPLADFNTLILRAEYNNAWTHNDGAQRLRGSNMRDQWIRNTQVAMSGLGARGNHVHLFFNGLYWASTTSPSAGCRLCGLPIGRRARGFRRYDA